MKDFYNTIKENGKNLFELIDKAKVQEVKILRYFLKNPDKHLTPFQVLEKAFEYDTLFYMRPPITSVRRAITNLTKKGLLIKTDRMKVERYATKNHYWKLDRNNIDQQLQLFLSNRTNGIKKLSA